MLPVIVKVAVTGSYNSAVDRFVVLPPDLPVIEQRCSVVASTPIHIRSRHKGIWSLGHAKCRQKAEDCRNREMIDFHRRLPYCGDRVPNALVVVGPTWVGPCLAGRGSDVTGYI